MWRYFENKLEFGGSILTGWTLRKVFNMYSTRVFRPRACRAEYDEQFLAQVSYFMRINVLQFPKWVEIGRYFM